MRFRKKRLIHAVVSVLAIGFILLVVAVYAQYGEFKKAAIARISAAVSSRIGQELTIGDLSVKPGGIICLDNIALHNPKGFRTGNVLEIGRLCLHVRYRALLSRQLSLEKIAILEPKITLVRNDEGMYNVSERLRAFFRREPTVRYVIDEVIVRSGVVDIDSDERFRNDDINLAFRNVSSEKMARTSLSGNTLYANTRLTIDGWIVTGEKPGKFSLSLSSPDVSVSAVQKSLQAYGLELKKTKVSFALAGEGDFGNGASLDASVRIRDARAFFLRTALQETELNVRAFLSFPEKKLSIRDLTLKAGGVASITGRGDVRWEDGVLAYDAWVTINDLDLSAIDVLENAAMTGIVRAENFRVHGAGRGTVPALSGEIRVEDASFRMQNYEVGRIDAALRAQSSSGGSIDVLLQRVKGPRFEVPSLRVASDITFRDREVRFDSFDLASPAFSLSSRHATIRLPSSSAGKPLAIGVAGLYAAHPGSGSRVGGGLLSITASKKGAEWSGSADFSADDGVIRGVRVGHVKGRVIVRGGKVYLDVPVAEVAGGRIAVNAAGTLSSSLFPVSLRASADHVIMEQLLGEGSQVLDISYPLSGILQEAAFEGTIMSADAIEGRASVRAENVAVRAPGSRSQFVKDVRTNVEITFQGKNATVRATLGAGNLLMSISGDIMHFAGKARSGEFSVHVPPVRAADIRETLWDVVPDQFLYVGLEGTLSSDVFVRFGEASTKVDGKVTLGNVLLEGENGEYTLGPVNGVIPIGYAKDDGSSTASFRDGGKNGRSEGGDLEWPSFERDNFRNLSLSYAGRSGDARDSILSVGKVRYGFDLLEDVRISLRMVENSLHATHVSGNIFGGKLNGSAVLSFADSVRYKGGFLIEELSLSHLCDRIDPIRGYLSGKLNGIAAFKGEGKSLSRLIGKAEFWTFSASNEKTKISKEFLQKIGGPSLRRYLGDRNFDRGVMDLYVQNGSIIFKELEISNRNVFGVKDLDIKVAPLNNRISLDHLLWAVTEAAYRARKK